MSEIRAIYNPGVGRHWFDRSSMRFFRTVLPRQGYQADDGTIYFVTSEQFVDSRGNQDPRRYTIRKMTVTKSVTNDEYKQNHTAVAISTIGEFNKITTSKKAVATAKMYANKIQRQ